MLRHHAAALAAAVAAIFAATDVPAQQPTVRKPQHVAATVAMVDEVPVPGAPFVVQRRPGATPADLILIRPSATAAELSDAVRTLATARAASGDYPLVPGIVRMRPNQKWQAVRKELPWTHGVLARLRNAQPRSIEGVGTVRAVAIWLPKQTRGSGALGAPKKP